MDLKSYIDKLKQIEAPMQSVYYWFKEEIKSELQYTHSQGQDPYGKPWEARKRLYPWPIMDKSGTMMRSFKVQIAGSRFIISNTTPYAKYHQDGNEHSRYLPVRNIVPTEMEGLPVEMAEKLEAYFQQKLAEYLG